LRNLKTKKKMFTSVIFSLKNSWELIFLGVLSFFTRFFNLSFPSKVVFDETHFGLYASKYLSHQYFFDIHPPLGKMILAFFGFLGKIRTDFNWAINSEYPLDFNFIAFRFLPAFLGSLLVVLIYLLVKEMGFSKRVAFLSSFLVLFGNAFIVQSRFILLDIILLFFIILSLYLFILSKRFSFFSFNYYLSNLLCGLALGCAISIKWTGFGILGIIWLFIVFEDKLLFKTFKEILLKIILIFIFPLLIYFTVFILHFYLLPFECNSNCGADIESKQNIASPSDKDFTEFFGFGRNQIPPGSFLEKSVKVNKIAWLTCENKDTRYLFESDWWTWPFMIKPILYFTENYNNKTSFIYFLGNPMVWWLGFLGIIGFFYLIIRNFFYKFKLKVSPLFYSYNTRIVVFAYIVYLFSFAAIPRFMLIYHYLPALTFSIIIFAIFFEGVIESIFGPSNKNEILFQNKKANILLFIILIAVFLSFLYFSPFTYGFPLTEQGFQSRMWLDTWSL